MAKLSLSYNSFSLDLYKQLSQNADGNLFYSPFSIVAAMSMCAAGARKNTEKQLKQVLHYSNLSNDDVHSGNAALHQHLHSLGTHVSLNVANRIFQKVNYQVNKEYADLLGRFYNSGTQSVDFGNAAQASRTINDWVAGQTNNKILNLVPETVITPLTQLILVNAIYFRGDWDLKFDKKMTEEQPFVLEDKSQHSVQMMGICGKKFAFLHQPEGLKADVCKLPYAGKNLSMSIILPHEGTKLSEIEAKLSGKSLSNILSHLMIEEKVNVFLPKFKFEQKFELAGVFAKLGAPDAFDSKKADFSGIKTPDDGLCISNIIHKAIVEVNEEGTEAAAATAVVMMKRSLAMEFPKEFRCNKPFVFFIHENTHHTVLFMGRYSRPE